MLQAPSKSPPVGETLASRFVNYFVIASDSAATSSRVYALLHHLYSDEVASSFLLAMTRFFSFL
ncbi:MAG: hypothetical protein JWQ54_3413 [Mucilaginibacter sp.]|nr:hypothetical protein [Mucilaginibacter sp.]